MHRTVFLLVIFMVGCQHLPQESPAVLRGRLVLEVEPNPLRAVALGDDLYEVSFDIVMRESGGVSVTIEEFTIEAMAFRTVVVRQVTLPGSHIVERGYPSTIEAGKYLRFPFTRRWSLPTPLLLSGASARVTARTRDANGRVDVSTLAVGIEVIRSQAAIVSQRPAVRYGSFTNSCPESHRPPFACGRRVIPGMSIVTPLSALLEQGKGALRPAKHRKALPGRVVFRSGPSSYYLKPSAILWIQAEGNYSRVHTSDGNFLVRETIGRIQERLADFGFLRTERSIVVNCERVVEVRRKARRSSAVILDDGTELPLVGDSRRLLEEALLGGA